MNRRLVIAASVVLFHIAALWALQSGLLKRAVEVIVPAEVLSEFISPPAPKIDVPQPSAPKPQLQQQPKRQAPPAPLPVATPAPAPAPAAPMGLSTPQPAAPVVAAPAATGPATPAASSRLELPSSDAAYLNNPKPAYPVLSKRLGEQGKVVVRVLIGVDGTAQQAEIRTSSGYDRLDQAALTTVLKWRYVPGKRGGVPEAMWFNVPINFVLE